MIIRLAPWLAVALPGMILTPRGPAAAQERAVEDYIAAIEAPQPGRDGPGVMTIQQLMEEYGVPGVSVAVIRDFDIQWAKGYGVADVETGAPVDTETMFQAASISKTLNAMAVLRAVQEGLFTLDTDINDILTSWTLDGGGFTRNRPVTPRTLTSHTSGLGDGFGFPGYDPEGPFPTVVQILDGEPPSNTRALFMEREPMTFEEYSGGGVLLMQLALSDAYGGRPYEDILREKVLEPIGMTRSSFEQPISPDNDRNAARGHDGEGHAQGPKWHVYPELAAAGLWTTPTDLARFAIEVQKSAIGESNRVLSRTTVQRMLSPVGVGSFAIGFAIAKEGEGWYFSHNGGNWGFRCTLMAHKVKGYGLAIMTNADRGGAVMAELTRRIQDAYEWDARADAVPRGYDPPIDRPVVEVPVDVLRRYAGRYRIGEDDLVVTISLDDGRLYATPEGGNGAPLFAASETEFFLKVAPIELTFTLDEAGEVTGMTVRQGGTTRTAEKIG